MSTKELLHNAVDEMTEDNKTEAQKAFEELERLRKPFTTIEDGDEKELFYKYLEEKYNSLG